MTLQYLSSNLLTVAPSIVTNFIRRQPNSERHSDLWTRRGTAKQQHDDRQQWLKTENDDECLNGDQRTNDRGTTNERTNERTTLSPLSFLSPQRDNGERRRRTAADAIVGVNGERTTTNERTNERKQTNGQSDCGPDRALVLNVVVCRPSSSMFVVVRCRSLSSSSSMFVRCCSSSFVVVVVVRFRRLRRRRRCSLLFVVDVRCCSSSMFVADVRRRHRCCSLFDAVVVVDVRRRRCSRRSRCCNMLSLSSSSLLCAVTIVVVCVGCVMCSVYLRLVACCEFGVLSQAARRGRLARLKSEHSLGRCCLFAFLFCFYSGTALVGFLTYC